MFEVGDLVQHKTTGMTGKVIGYGYRKISDSYYLTTLKVELSSYSSVSSIVPIAEDLFDRWKARQDRQILACTLPHFPKRKRTLQTSNC
jgi:hypothetical protein